MSFGVPGVPEIPLTTLKHVEKPLRALIESQGWDVSKLSRPEKIERNGALYYGIIISDNFHLITNRSSYPRNALLTGPGFRVAWTLVGEMGSSDCFWMPTRGEMR